MLDGAYGAIKAVNRHDEVIGGATFTTGDIYPKLWIENMRLPNGRRPRMDMYAHNPFTRKAPNFHDRPESSGAVQFSDLPELAGWVDRYLHRGLPLFLSEWSIPTAPDAQFNFWVDAPVAASWIRDALRLSSQWKRIAALGWIPLYDDPSAGSFSGLLYSSGKRKPLFNAFAR